MPLEDIFQPTYGLLCEQTQQFGNIPDRDRVQAVPTKTATDKSNFKKNSIGQVSSNHFFFRNASNTL